MSIGSISEIVPIQPLTRERLNDLSRVRIDLRSSTRQQKLSLWPLARSHHSRGSGAPEIKRLVDALFRETSMAD